MSKKISAAQLKAARAKFNSFAKEVLSRLVGDDNDVLAQKITRKSLSAIMGQVASLKASLVDAQINLENELESFANAKYPTDYIPDNQAYCAHIIASLSEVDKAQDTVDDVENSIEVFEEMLNDFTDGKED